MMIKSGTWMDRKSWVSRRTFSCSCFWGLYSENLTFMEYEKLSIDDAANFIRHELVKTIRKGPYSFYFGSVIEARKAAHGYAEFLINSTMDTLEHEDVPLEEAKKTINQCLYSLRERFLMSQANFTIKVIIKDGIEVICQAERPAGVENVQGVSQAVTRGY